MGGKIREAAQCGSRGWRVLNLGVIGAILLGLQFLRGEDLSSEALMDWLLVLLTVGGVEFGRSKMEG